MTQSLCTETKVEIITDSEGLAKLQSDWTFLLQNSDSNSIFLTWEWMSTWWDLYGDGYRLNLIAIRNSENKLIGIAPFKVARRRYFGICRRDVLEFIGAGEDITPELLDIIAWKGLESEVNMAVLNQLLEHKLFDTFDLWPFAEHSANLAFLVSNLAKKNHRFRMVQSSSCPVMSLPESWEELLSSKSRNFKKKAKENWRVCKRDLGIELIKCDSNNYHQHGMDPLIRLHCEQRNGNSNSFRDKRNISFHTKLADLFIDRGWLRLFYLKCEGKIVAGIYCFCYNNKYYYYQSGRDLRYQKYHLGYVILNCAIHEAINESSTQFNFLTGNEKYKFHWAESIESSARLWSWGNSWMVPECCYLLRNIAKKVVYKLGMRENVLRFFRGFDERNSSNSHV
jgi:CelD/BcsL family acetyltransferase involved in cellulose biosynthesis